MTHAADEDLRQAATTLLLVLLVLGWLGGTAYLVFGAAITSAPFFGEQPSHRELADAARLLRGAAGCAVLPPLAGLLLARRTRRAGWARAFLAATLVGAVAAAILAFAAADLDPASGDRVGPSRPGGPSICQEHSGSDNRCPGD